MLGKTIEKIAPPVAALAAFLISLTIMIGPPPWTQAAQAAPAPAAVQAAAPEADLAPHGRVIVTMAIALPKTIPRTVAPRAVVRSTRAVTRSRSFVRPRSYVVQVRVFAVPSSARAFQQCVARHETPGSSHPYTQVNLGGSSASGRYQYIDSTWRTWAARAGFSGYSRALYAPPAVQDAVFFYTITHGGRGNWGPDGC